MQVVFSVISCFRSQNEDGKLNGNTVSNIMNF